MNWLQPATEAKWWDEVAKETKIPDILDCEQNLNKKFGIITSCKQDVSDVKNVTCNYAVIANDKKLAVHDIASDRT